ncbi:MAG: hypothetical protein CMI13_01240 [Oleibacter sp.]|nr:hypothetical protein [Thalassolituus sp.]
MPTFCPKYRAIQKQQRKTKNHLRINTQKTKRNNKKKPAQWAGKLRFNARMDLLLFWLCLRLIHSQSQTDSFGV